jgi:chromosome segregation ATPase
MQDILNVKDQIGEAGLKVKAVADSIYAQLGHWPNVISSLGGPANDIDTALYDVADALLTAANKLNDLNTTFDNLNGAVDTKINQLLQWASDSRAQIADAQAKAAAAVQRLNDLKNRVGDDYQGVVSIASDWATLKSNQALAAANQNMGTARDALQGQIDSARDDLNGVMTRLDNIKNRTGDDWANIKAQIESTSVAERPLWTDYTDSALAQAKSDATDKANAALAAANQNISDLDAKMADKINNSDGRIGDLENEFPLTTAALNKRIDDANQASTDKANAALAAANQNIATLQDKLTADESTVSDLKARVSKLETEINKVAPILDRIPKL